MQATHIFRPNIRDATPDDALCLGILATQVFLDTYATEGIRPAIANAVLNSFSTHAFAELLKQEKTYLRVAEHQNHLIGFSQITIGTQHEQVPSIAPAELDRLYIQERFTGMGVGSFLLQDAEALAASLAATDLWLTPWVRNQRALLFYERQGYLDLGTCFFQMEGEAHENLLISKTLMMPVEPMASSQ